MAKSGFVLAFLALLVLCYVQAQTPESIKVAQDSIGVAYGVSAQGLGRAETLKGVLQIDIYNRIADVRAQYVILGLNTSGLDTLQSTWSVILDDDLKQILLLAEQGLEQTSALNQDLTLNLPGLQLDLLSLISTLNQIDQAYNKTDADLTASTDAFVAEINASLLGQTGQPVIDSYVAMQRALDALTYQENLDDELRLIIDWRIRQAIAAVQNVINQIP